ncbi:uncharacterized protein LOC130663741 isoform X2 [Microplitis mediator]|uniref:uncharacterized protein LOC130663741 isoform X2 n=1 Tax=Microplitis mediator TaxID=375433 RepID=UPI002553B375|nr:uncharacterized protein LOC130663741 isoform X2 [Microplitis mediator]
MSAFKLETKKKNNEVIKDKEEIKSYSGLKLISSTKVFEKFLDICYCTDSKEFLLLDDGLKIHRYLLDGQVIHPSFILSPSMLFSKIIWCESIKLFACYAPHYETIWLLDQKFKSIQTIRNEFKIENLIFSYDEFIVVGLINVTRYLKNKFKLTFECHQKINIMDDNYGSVWSIQCSSLITIDINSPLKLTGSYLTTMYVMPLNPDEDEDTSLPVKFLSKKINASASAITALYYQSASKWIITGDQLGNVSAWTINLDRVFNYLAGHKGAVKTIISHPSICGFITTSTDNILQVWSCNFKDKSESFSNLGAITSMAINESSSLVTLGTKLTFFYTHQLYLFYSPLTAKPNILLSTQNLIHPMRIVVSNNYNHTISILSSASGKQINVIVLPSNVDPISMSYSSTTTDIYIVPMKIQNIIILNSKIYPMKIKNSWTSEKRITTVVVYDHHQQIESNQFQTANPNCMRVIAGTDTGELISIEESTGKFQQIIKAHKGSIKKLCASYKSRHIFSIAEDRCVKAWRIFPDIIEPLALNYCIYLTTPVINIASVGFSVCVITSTNARHQLLMYDIKNKNKYQHNQSKDHDKRILDISTLESLLICVTSSEDFTLRVWSKQNDLLKIIEINLSAAQLTFSSLRGDIIFSCGKHLYLLPHENYLPERYKIDIEMKNICEEKEEDIMARDEDDDEYMEYEEDEIKSRALHPVSSVPLCSLDPSSDIPHLGTLLQEQKLMHFKLRDRDIKAIEQGTAELSEKRQKMKKKKAFINYDEWNKYVDDLAKDIESKNKNKNNFPYNFFQQRRRAIEKSSYASDFMEFNYEWLEKTIPNSLVSEKLKEDNKEPEPPTEKKTYKYKYPEIIDKKDFDNEDLLSMTVEDLNETSNNLNI